MTNTVSVSFMLATLSLIQIAPAAITYTYTGNNFTTARGTITTSDHISVSFTVPSALPPSATVQVLPQPSSSSMSDGVNFISSSPSDLVLTLYTDSSGNIYQWEIFSPHPLVQMSTLFVGLYDYDSTNGATRPPTTGTVRPIQEGGQ
jgi:hypothetical protein